MPANIPKKLEDELNTLVDELIDKNLLPASAGEESKKKELIKMVISIVNKASPGGLNEDMLSNKEVQKALTRCLIHIGRNEQLLSLMNGEKTLDDMDTNEIKKSLKTLFKGLLSDVNQSLKKARGEKQTNKDEERLDDWADEITNSLIVKLSDENIPVDQRSQVINDTVTKALRNLFAGVNPKEGGDVFPPQELMGNLIGWVKEGPTFKASGSMDVGELLDTTQADPLGIQNIEKKREESFADIFAEMLDELGPAYESPSPFHNLRKGPQPPSGIAH